MQYQTATLSLLLFAACVIVLGVVAGRFVKYLVRGIFKKGRVDDVLVATGAKSLADRTGIALDMGTFIGTLLEWSVILFFLDIALDMLHLQSATAFLGGVVLAYLPRIFVAAAILFLAFIFAHRADKVIAAEAHTFGVRHASALGRLARALILACAILAVLIQLHIASEMALILFAGIVFGTSLAFGIAFGFAGRDTAGRYINAVVGEEKE